MGSINSVSAEQRLANSFKNVRVIGFVMYNGSSSSGYIPLPDATNGITFDLNIGYASAKFIMLHVIETDGQITGLCYPLYYDGIDKVLKAYFAGSCVHAKRIPLELDIKKTKLYAEGKEELWRFLEHHRPIDTVYPNPLVSSYRPEENV